MAKRPSFQFYPGDWLQATDLRSCSIGARGLWIDMICLMHSGSPYGYLKVACKVILAVNLARIVGATLPEVEGWIAELTEAGVVSVDEEGCFYSRRMIRDEQIREARAAGGVKGGNPALVKRSKVSGKVNLQGNLQPTPSSSSSSSSLYSFSPARDEQESAATEQQHPDDAAAFLEGPDSEFQIFWGSYPVHRRTGEQAAWREWQGAIITVLQKLGCDDRTAMTHLQQRVILFAASQLGKSKFCWAPATFLKDGHYDDPLKSWELNDDKPARSKKSSFENTIDALSRFAQQDDPQGGIRESHSASVGLHEIGSIQ